MLIINLNWYSSMKKDIHKYLEKKFNKTLPPCDFYDYRHNIKFDLIDLATEEEIDNIINYINNYDEDNSQQYEKDNRFLRLAKEISTWSKDPSTQVGAVAVSENGSLILSQGYNGFPRNIKDDYRLYIRKVKYPMVVHAEMNMIFNASMNGVNLSNSTVYVYGLPVCPECAKGLLQVGVKRVVTCIDSNNKQYHIDNYDKVTSHLFDEANIHSTFITIPFE